MAIYENPGFPVSKPVVSQSQDWSFSGLFFDFRFILTSGGYLLKIALKDS